MELIDTHCHIQFNDYGLDPDQVWQDAKKAGVTKIIVVGDDVESSIAGVKFASNNDGVYVAVGVHPHHATSFLKDKDAYKKLDDLLKDAKTNKIVAIGEFGLDYYYQNSVKADQLELLKIHLDLAKKYNLPCNFHVRDAFDDFWPVFDQYNGVRGVIHSFTSTEAELDNVLKRGLYVGLNGIMTFTKNPKQLEMAKSVPLDRLLIETDAPYLTPKPFRGNICKPEHVALTAEYLIGLRREDPKKFWRTTTNNAIMLFSL